MDDMKCQEIAGWAMGLSIPLVPDPRVIVDTRRDIGDPLLDSERRELRLHPKDYLALQAWGDRQLVAA